MKGKAPKKTSCSRCIEGRSGSWWLTEDAAVLGAGGGSHVIAGVRPSSAAAPPLLCRLSWPQPNNPRRGDLDPSVLYMDNSKCLKIGLRHRIFGGFNTRVAWDLEGLGERALVLDLGREGQMGGDVWTSGMASVIFPELYSARWRIEEREGSTGRPIGHSRFLVNRNRTQGIASRWKLLLLSGFFTYL